MSSTWTATDGELAALVQRGNWQLRPSSPLFRLTQVKAAGFVQEPGPDWTAVVQRVAYPRLELGLSLSPPASLELLWFFLGEDDGWAGHFVDRLGRHRFAQVAREDVYMALHHTLALDQNVPGGPTRLTLDQATLKTLVALLDCNREWTLESLLQRVPRPQRIFTVPDVLFSFLRSWDWGDRRWLTGALQAVSPRMEVLTAPDVDQGLTALGKAGMTEAVEEGWFMTLAGQTLAARVAAPVSYAGVRAHLPELGRTHHVAAILGTVGTLWMEFDGDRIALTEPASRELRETLESRLQEWISASAERRPVAVSPPASRTCPSCARALDAEARFCSYCGTSLVASNCPSCQAALAP
ncbi:MAG: zinc ribbon domain-containing protein, partial [Candidatus Eremiobacterota bacterium]